MTPSRKRGHRSIAGPEQVEPRYLMDAAPQLVADSFAVRTNDDPAPLDVLANDVRGDYAGPALVTAVSFPTAGGTAEVSADGRFVVFRPGADFAGDDTFTYVVDGQFTATVSVRVVSPLAGDAATALPDGPLVIDPLANDPFWSGYAGARRITALSATQLGGSVTIGADGRTVIYTAPDDPDMLGQTDHFSYIVDGRYMANVAVGLFDPLVAADRYLPQETGPTVLEPLANSNFVQWPAYTGPQRLTKLIEPVSGSRVSIGADGRTIVYTPAAGFVGTDTIAYVVDGRFSSTMTIYVGPVVREDYHWVDQNDPGAILYVLANDFYGDSTGHAIRLATSITSVSQADHGGKLQILPDGSAVRYTPAPGFVGSESFTYLANGRYTARVTVNVSRPVRDDPYPQTIVADSLDNVIDVLANDFHGAGNHTISHVTAPDEGGSVRIGGGGKELLYTPRAGFIGEERFTYTVDGQYTAAVFVRVQSPAGTFYTEFGPVVGDTYRIAPASYLPGLGNYSGAGRITAVSVTSGSATVTISPDGKALLLVSSDFSTVQVSYTFDGKYTAIGTISFRQSRFLGWSNTVVEQNQASPLDVLARAPWQYVSDFGQLVYQGPRRITAAFDAQHGTVSVSADGKSVIYRPNEGYVGPDSFRYLVDGRELATATVRVIRRVRDDQYRVDAGSRDNNLPVTVNDQLGGGYTGIGRITEVGTPGHGTAQISADGRKLVYTPTAGFSGVDTVEYTVDGHLRATVEITVAAAEPSWYPRFDTLAALEEWLIASALERYGSIFGTPGYGRMTTDQLMDVSSNSTAGHSDTNVQVAGVDEADLTENDGDFLYVLSGGELVITRANGESLAVVSETDFEGQPVGMYLAGNRLTVVSRVESFPFVRGLPTPWLPRPWDGAHSGTTIVTVFDVTDRGAPALVQKTKLDGAYLDSRRIGNYVYLALDNASFALPPPQFVDDPSLAVVDQWGQPNRRYETQQEYLARIRENFGEVLDSVLPHFRSYGPDGDLVRSGLMLTPEEIGTPWQDGDPSLLSVVTIDAAASEPGIEAATGLVTVSGGQIYMNQGGLYVLRTSHTGGENQTTDILKFAIGTTGQAEPVARGQVPGQLVNQFSVDESDGYLRIATTVSNAGADNWSGIAENNLWILKQDGLALEVVGGLQNLAPGESIRSVRFVGDRAVITTFPTAQVGYDPVLAVDLSDPARPRLLGALVLPGFNHYMQFIDDTHVLAVGVNAPAVPGHAAFGLPPHVSLFDVSDFAHPRLIDQYTLARFSTSVAQQDHHAFGWFADLGLLALPVSRSYTKREDLDGDGYFETSTAVTTDEVHYFRIRTDLAPGAGRAVDAVGTIALGAKSLRSAFIGDVLYAIGDGQIVASTLDAPGTPLASVTWEVAPVVYPPVVYPIDLRIGWPITIRPIGELLPPLDWKLPLQPPPVAEQDQLDSWIGAARDDLGRRLGVSPESALLVLVEVPASASAGGDSVPAGLRFVLRSGEQHLLYEVTAAGAVESVDANFEFSSVGVAATGESPEPDVDGNGRVSARDALLVINQLLKHGGPSRVGQEVLRQVTPSTVQAAADVNRDGRITARDALLVINLLLARQAAAAPAAAFAAVDPAPSAPAAASKLAAGIVFSQPMAASLATPAGISAAETPREAAPPAAPQTVFLATATMPFSGPSEHDLALSQTEDWSPLDDSPSSNESDDAWQLDARAL
jgi:hypothetical protein